MAKKEIRQLYARLQKKERPSGGEVDLKVRVSGNKDLQVVGLSKLKIFRRDLAAFYKQIVTAVMVEAIDKV